MTPVHLLIPNICPSLSLGRGAFWLKMTSPTSITLFPFKFDITDSCSFVKSFIVSMSHRLRSANNVSASIFRHSSVSSVPVHSGSSGIGPISHHSSALTVLLLPALLAWLVFSYSYGLSCCYSTPVRTNPCTAQYTPKCIQWQLLLFSFCHSRILF